MGQNIKQTKNLEDMSRRNLTNLINNLNNKNFLKEKLKKLGKVEFSKNKFKKFPLKQRMQFKSLMRTHTKDRIRLMTIRLFNMNFKNFRTPETK